MSVMEDPNFLQPNEYNEINISVRLIQWNFDGLGSSSGWLASFRPYDDPHQYESFSTVSAAKEWLVEKFNEYTRSGLKSLPWVEQSDHLTANCVYNEETGEVNFNRA